MVGTDHAELGLGRDGNDRLVVQEYLTGPAHANDLFNSSAAARTAFLNLSHVYVLIGSSQGRGAAWAFAEKLASEPMNGHLGIVVLHLVLRLLGLPLVIPIITPIIILLAPGLIAKLLNLNSSEVFTPEAMVHLDVFPDSKRMRYPTFPAVLRREYSAIQLARE